MANNVANIKLEPCDATWEIEEKWDITAVADVSSSLNNKYFVIRNGADAKFHVWFNVASGGTDPAPANSTAIVVAISANATASTIATAVAAAVDANAHFLATSSGAVITITAAVAGQSTDWADFNTTFEFVQVQDGGSLALGYLEGDIEVTFEETQLDINAHQTGTTILASLRQGLVNNVSLTMKEADYAKYKELMLGTAGGAYTPSGGTEVFGWGTASLGANTIVKARRLVLHPVALGSGVKTRDLCFWKSYALPDSLTISGENPKTLSLSFKVYKDDSKPEAVNQFVFGDWSQTEFVP